MKADLVLKSSAVFTGLGDEPFRGGIAVTGNKIMAVEENDGIDMYIGSDTKVFEYGDNLIMAGITDSHAHFLEGTRAISKQFLGDISDCMSEAEAARRVKKFADANPDIDRVIGTGWHAADWEDQKLPTKRSLDEVISDKPVYLTSYDMHTCWMNSAALKEAGIPTNTQDVEFGELIGVFPDGELNGLLFEQAHFKYGVKWYNYMKPEDDIAAHLKFMNILAQAGITMFCDLSGHLPDRTYETLEKIDREDRMPIRVNIHPGIRQDCDYTEALEQRTRLQSDKLRVAGLKGIIDGVTSTYTGLLIEPYSDRPDTCGEPSAWGSYELYEKAVIAANRAGFSVRIHAIGDLAVRWCLNMYEESNRLNDNANIRNSVEHIESIHPSDIPRFGRLGVVASMQPEHLPQDGYEKITRIGMERGKYEWPMKSIHNSGGVLCFGSDYPVVSYNPYPGIYYAVTRNGYDRKPVGVNPEEKIGLADTLRAYTRNGAYVAGREKDFGTLEKGKLADVIVLDRNLFAVDAETIPDTEILLTIVDGKVIYEKE